jgi:predicted GNAT family acetyltransferase
VTEIEVKHIPEQNRFEIKAEGETAVLDYILKGATITFTHTGVPSALEGKGIGSKLAKAGLDYARTNKLKVRALCWFVDGYIQRHPEYQELLESKTTA